MGSSGPFKVGRGTGRPTRAEQPATHYKALSTDTDGAYTFGEHVLVVDFPPHIHHREDEGLYVLEGQLTATVGEDRFSLGPGDFVFMPKGVPHSLSSGSSSSPRLLFISTPGGFEHFMDDFVELTAQGLGPRSEKWMEMEAKHDWTLLERRADPCATQFPALRTQTYSRFSRAVAPQQTGCLSPTEPIGARHRARRAVCRSGSRCPLRRKPIVEQVATAGVVGGRGRHPPAG